MKDKYNIPLQFKNGKFSLAKLSTIDDNCLLLSHDDYDILSYFVPEYGTDVRIYSVTEEDIKETLFAVYNENGQLENIEITCSGKTKLVYIHFSDNENAKENMWKFANFYAVKISDRIISCKEKVARLFIEYFYDGAAVDFAAKVGTVRDMQSIIEQYGEGTTAVDNCGDYPYENRVECDSDTLGIMLLCSEPDFRSDLFGFAVYVMINSIKERVLDVIDKAEDFKFIAKEYD